MAMVPATCTRCGAGLRVDSEKDAAVCEYCGTPFVVEKAIRNYRITNHIHADVVNIFNPVGNEYDQRAEAMDRMTRMIRHFSEKRAEYEELESVASRMSREQAGIGKTPLIIGILLTVVGILLLARQNDPSKAPTFILMVLLPGLILIGLFILRVVLTRKKLAALSARRNELLDILHRHYDAFPYCPVGFEYTHPADLESLYDILRQGKATSIKEALNLFFREQGH